MAQQTRYIDFMLVQCWATVFVAVPTLNQNRINVSCLLGGGGGGVLHKKVKKNSYSYISRNDGKDGHFSS